MKGFLDYVLERIAEMGKLYGTNITFAAGRGYKKNEASTLRDLKILQRANRVYAGDDPLKLQYIEFQVLEVDNERYQRPEWVKLVVVKDQINVYEILRGNNQYTKAAIRPVKNITFAVKG